MLWECCRKTSITSLLRLPTKSVHKVKTDAFSPAHDSSSLNIRSFSATPSHTLYESPDFQIPLPVPEAALIPSLLSISCIPSVSHSLLFPDSGGRFLSPLACARKPEKFSPLETIHLPQAPDILEQPAASTALVHILPLTPSVGSVLQSHGFSHPSSQEYCVPSCSSCFQPAPMPGFGRFSSPIPSQAIAGSSLQIYPCFQAHIPPEYYALNLLDSCD